MSDANSAGGTGEDFRGSREEKRQDETVMITSENLSDMVTSAKQGGTVEPTKPNSNEDALAQEVDLADNNLGRWLVIFGIVALLIAVVIIVLVNVID